MDRDWLDWLFDLVPFKSCPTKSGTVCGRSNSLINVQCNIKPRACSARGWALVFESLHPSPTYLLDLLGTSPSKLIAAKCPIIDTAPSRLPALTRDVCSTFVRFSPVGIPFATTILCMSLCLNLIKIGDAIKTPVFKNQEFSYALTTNSPALYPEPL